RLDKVPFRDNLLARLHEFWAVGSLGGAPDAMLVAAGQAEIWIEPSGAPWDLAPLKIVLEEAGARFFAYDVERTIYAGHCIACAPGVEADVRRWLEIAPAIW